MPPPRAGHNAPPCLVAESLARPGPAAPRPACPSLRSDKMISPRTTLRKHVWTRYGLAAVAVAAGLGLRRLLTAHVGEALPPPRYEADYADEVL